ncbi:carbohydrate ABC transporter permease [Micromonospora mirobrigensis]|uniref:Carbohydrate ABC transporter membrane protein 2, CUT1 family (TC 3.A.1.1.-) n=1 Tax=Micromonospora mirobrigensis TaxID=262898 RepID=A0A1C5AL59_9ACTN|nr:carbohydrate ABC transporter permease [Micromonospora mirobrigensis]SCF45734.1 carbohydrate ABC transporter membrane protein 2, CUT1 family (TC 3.A.1.1.-) [Micromonospora mirobrigensis]
MATYIQVRHHRRRPVAPMRMVGTGLIWLFTGFCLFAFGFMVLSAFKSNREILASPWALPTSMRWENWANAWEQGGFGTAAINSVLLVSTASLTAVAVAAPAAYVLSRGVSRTAAGLTMYFALGLGIPVQVIVLPLYSLMAKLQLIDTMQGLFLVYVATALPFTVFLLTGFFATLPTELVEAAALDGLSPGRTFWQIMFPLARGGLTTALLLNVIGMWNETLLALMFVQSRQNNTLPLALIGFIQSQQYNGADYGALFAGVLITILPIIMVYVWLGNRITQGITAGIGK